MKLEKLNMMCPHCRQRIEMDWLISTLKSELAKRIATDPKRTIRNLFKVAKSKKS